MMSREHHRRRSPESSRRRRKERRDSREQLQSHPIPAPIPLYGDMYSQPHQQSFQSPYQQPFQDSFSVPYQSPYQPEPPVARDPDRERDRAPSSPLSSTSYSSSTSSSLVNISQPSRGFGLGSFFSSSARKQRRRVKKKRSKILRFGNSSSSSVGSDLAYGRGYIDRRRSSREFSPPAGQQPPPPRRDSNQERPRPPRRAQTDEEIIELGRKFAELARQQNTDDLRAAGRTRPSTIASAATAINQFRRTNSGNVNKGIGNSKPHLDSSADDSDWESASSDDESSEGDSDNGLAYGSSHHLLGSSGRQSQSGASVPPSQTYVQGIPLNRKPSLVDPKLFGPINSLRGFVQTPCGFDRVDRNALGDERPHYEPPFTPSERIESADGRPMQHVYPVPTSDPSRFDAGRGSVPATHPTPPTSRPDPVPIQQPKPITPVPRKVLDSVDSDLKYSNRSSTRGAAPTAGVGLPDATIKAPLSSDAAIGALLRAARGSDQRKKEKPRSDDIQLRHERGSDKRYDEEHETHDDREVLRYIPPQKSAVNDSEAALNEKIKRYREPKEPNPDYEPRRESRPRDKYRDELDRSAKAEQEKNDFKGERINSRSDKRREISDKGKSVAYEPQTDVVAPSRELGNERGKDVSDPFKYQVADTSLPTPGHGAPARPLTPVIMTVEREPDFSKFDTYDPHERLSRKDSFERELRDAQKAYKAVEQATVPVNKTAFAAAAAAEIAARRLKRSSEKDDNSRGHSQDSTGSTRPKDPVLDDADRAYREATLARRIREQQERSRSNSPDSVVDKWKEEKDSAPTGRIETPPAMEQVKQKSIFDGPNADVRIDNVLEHPRDLARFRVSESRCRSSTFPLFSARDPSAERERPMLNLVRPTPAPTPNPEKQQSRAVDLPSPAVEVQTRSAPTAEHEDVVSAPSVAPSKAVTWGENQTYVVENSDREDDPYSGTKIITPAVTPRSRTDKKSGWAAAATAAFGIGAGVAASAISDSAKETDATRDHVDSEESGPSSKRRSSSKFDSFYDDEPPVPGPKPSNPRAAQIPGRFSEDPVFMANIAAGLEGSGFDPNIIIDDAKFHRRDSPPGSSEPLTTSRDGVGKSPIWEGDQRTRDSTFSHQQPEPSMDDWADSLSRRKSKKSRKATVIQQDSAYDSGRDSQHDKAGDWEQRSRDFDVTRESTFQEVEPSMADSGIALQELSAPGKDKKKKKKRSKKGSLTDDPDASMIASPELSRESSYMMADPEADPISVRENREKRVTWDRGDEIPDISRRLPAREDIVDSYNDPRSESAAATEGEWVDLPQKAKKKKKKPKRDASSREGSPPASQYLSRSGDSIERPERSFTDSSFTDTGLRSGSLDANLEAQEEKTRAKRRSAPSGFPEFEALNDYDFNDREREVSAVDDRPQSSGSGFFGRLRSSMGFNEGKEESQIQNKETNSFLGSAGALGASAGLTGSAIALAYQKLTANAAADTTPETESPGASERRSSSPDETELIDPEIVEREIRPAIDPTYGDLLPLPPSRSTSPVPDLDEAIPPLPESRPGTPEDERERLLLAQKVLTTHVRRRSETPLRVKTPSQSAIPIQFRLGQRTTPASPSVRKQSPSASPISATQETGSSSRRPRPMSWESTRTFKPLLLLERTSREPVTPSSLHEELELTDVRDEPEHMSSPTRSRTIAPLHDIEDARPTRRSSTQSPQSPQLPPLERVEEPGTPTEHPETAGSMSKNRSSYLFYSSPSGTQASDEADIPEGSPSLRAARRYTTLEDVEEDPVTDTYEGDLFMTAAGGLATGALVTDALVDDHVTPLEAPSEIKDRGTMDITDVEFPTGLGKIADTNETESQDKEAGEVIPAPAKKTKKGKKGKNKSREVETVAEAPEIQAPAEPEIPLPLSADVPEPAAKTEEQDDGASAVKLSKKEKKKRKKEQARALLAEEEKAPEVSIPIEDEKTPEPPLPVVEEKSLELTSPTEEEKPVQPVLLVEEEKPREMSLPVEEREPAEPTLLVEDDKILEPFLPMEDEKPAESLKLVEEEKPLEMSLPAEEQKPVEPILLVEDEKTSEPSLSIEDEKASESLKPVEEEKPLERSLATEEGTSAEPVLLATNEKSSEPSILVEDEKAPELSLPVEDEKTPESSNPAEEEKTPVLSSSAEDEHPAQPVLQVENEKSIEPLTSIEEEKKPESALPVEDDQTTETVQQGEDQKASELPLVQDEKTLEPSTTVEHEETIEPSSIPAELQKGSELPSSVEAETSAEVPLLAEDEKAPEPSPPVDDKRVGILDALAKKTRAETQEEKDEAGSFTEDQPEQYVVETPEWGDDQYSDEDNVTPDVPEKKPNWGAIAAAAFGAGAGAFFGKRATATPKAVEAPAESSANAAAEAPVETPIQPPADPIAEAPTETAIEAPVRRTPVEETSTEKVPIKEALTEEMSDVKTPVEQAFVEEAPIEVAPVDKAPVEEVTHEAHVDTAAEPTDILAEGTINAPVEVPNEPILETPAEIPTDVTETVPETSTLDESVVTSKKSKKKKKKSKSQVQEPEAEEQPAPTVPQSVSMEENVTAAPGESAAPESSSLARHGAIPQLDTTPLETDATNAPILDTALTTEPVSLDVGESDNHLTESVTLDHGPEHVQGLPVEPEDALPKDKGKTSEDTPQGPSAAEEVSAAPSTKSKKKKKRKQSQVSEPESEMPAVADSQAPTQDVEEIKQAENEAVPSQVPDETVIASEAASSSQTGKVDADALFSAPLVTEEPTSIAVTDSLDEQPDRTLESMPEASQQSNDIVQPAISGEPISDEKSLDLENQAETPMQANESASAPLQQQITDDAHPPELDVAEESLLKSDIPQDESVLPTVDSTDVTREPITEITNEVPDTSYSQPPTVAESSTDLRDTPADKQPSPAVQPTSEESTKLVDEPEEPRSKKKDKKKKKKKQSVSELPEPVEAADTSVKAEDVQERPTDDGTATDKDPLQGVVDPAVGVGPTEVPSGDIMPDPVVLSRESKEVERSADEPKESDAWPTQQAEELLKPAEELPALDTQDVAPSDNLAVTSPTEPTAGESISEPATPTKKGKKKGKKNRQSVDPTDMTENEGSVPAEPDPVAAEGAADITQLEQESSPLATTEADMTTEKDTTEAEPVIETPASKKKSKKEKKKRESTQLELGSSSETMPEKMDSSSAQQETSVAPQLEENLTVEPVIDNPDANAAELVNTTEDTSLSPKKSKKKQKRQISGPTEEDDTSDLPGPIPESVSSLKEVPHIPEQVQEDDADVSSTSTITKKSKKDKKKKRQSVQFAEPIEESREMPTEDLNRLAASEVTAEPVESPLETPSQPTTSLESSSSPLDTTRSLDSDQVGSAAPESSENLSSNLDDSSVPVPADEDPSTSLAHDGSSPPALPSAQLDWGQNLEPETHDEAGSTQQGVDSRQQNENDANATVPSDSLSEILNDRQVEVQPEKTEPEATSDASVPTDGIVLSDDKPATGGVIPITEDPSPATANDEASSVTKKSKKDKKKRKGKSQETQESASDAVPTSENQDVNATSETNIPETQESEVVGPTERLPMDEAAVDKPTIEGSTVEAPSPEEPAHDPWGIEKSAIEEPVTTETTLNRELPSDTLDTEVPIVEEPTAEAPITEGPIVEEPANQDPASEELVVEELEVQESTAQELAAEKPSAVEELPTHEPVVEEPSAQEPTVGEPIVEELVENPSAEPTVDEPAPEATPKKSKKSKKKSKKNSTIVDDETAQSSDVVPSSVVGDEALGRDKTADVPQPVVQEEAEATSKASDLSIPHTVDKEMLSEMPLTDSPSLLNDQSQSGQDRQIEVGNPQPVDETVSLTHPLAGNLSTVGPEASTAPEAERPQDALASEEPSEPTTPTKSKKDKKKKKKRDSQLLVEQQDNTETPSTNPTVDVKSPAVATEQTTAPLLDVLETSASGDILERQPQGVDSHPGTEPGTAAPPTLGEVQSPTDLLNPAEPSLEQLPSTCENTEATDQPLSTNTEGDRIQESRSLNDEPSLEEPAEQTTDQTVPIQTGEDTSSALAALPEESNVDDIGNSTSDKKSKKDKKKKKKKQGSLADDGISTPTAASAEPVSESQEPDGTSLPMEPDATISTDIPLKSDENTQEQMANIDDSSLPLVEQSENDNEKNRSSLPDLEPSSEPQSQAMPSAPDAEEQVKPELPVDTQESPAEEPPKTQDSQETSSATTTKKSKKKKKAADKGEETPLEEQKDLPFPALGEGEVADATTATPIDIAETATSTEGKPTAADLDVVPDETILQTDNPSIELDTPMTDADTTQKDVPTDDSIPKVEGTSQDEDVVQREAAVLKQSGPKDEGALQDQPRQDSEDTNKDITAVEDTTMTDSQLLDDAAPSKKSKKNKKKKKQSISQVEDLPEGIPAQDAESTKAAGMIDIVEDQTPTTPAATQDEMDVVTPGPDEKASSREAEISAEQHVIGPSSIADAPTSEPVAPEASNIISDIDSAPPKVEEKGISFVDEVPKENQAEELTTPTTDPAVIESATAPPSNEDSPVPSTPTKKSKKDKKKKKQAAAQEDAESQQVPSKEELPELQEPAVQSEPVQEDVPQETPVAEDLSKQEQADELLRAQAPQLEESRVGQDVLTPEEPGQIDVPIEMVVGTSPEPAPDTQPEEPVQVEASKSGDPPNEEDIDAKPTKKSKKDKKKKKKASISDPEASLLEEPVQSEEAQPVPAADSAPEAEVPKQDEGPSVATFDETTKGEDPAPSTPTKKSKKDKKKQASLEAEPIQVPVETSANVALLNTSETREPTEISPPEISEELKSVKPYLEDKDSRESEASIQPELSQEPDASQQPSGEVSQSDALLEPAASGKSKKKKKKRANTLEVDPEPKIETKDDVESAAWPTETLELTGGETPIPSESQPNTQGAEGPEAISKDNKSIQHDVTADPSVNVDDAVEMITGPKLSEGQTEPVAQDAAQATLPKDQPATTDALENEQIHEAVLDTTPAIGTGDSPPLQGPETTQLEEATPPVGDGTETVPSKKSKKDKKKKKRASQVSWEPGPEAEIEDLPEQQQSERTFDEQPTTNDSAEMGTSGKPVEDPSPEFKSDKTSEKKERQSQMEWEPEPNSAKTIEEAKSLPSTEQGQHDDMLLDHQSLAGDAETSLKHSTNLDDTFLETTSSKKSKKKKKKASQLDEDAKTTTLVTSEPTKNPLLVEGAAMDKDLKPVDPPAGVAIEPVQVEANVGILPSQIDLEPSQDKDNVKRQSIAETDEPKPDVRQLVGDNSPIIDDIPRQTKLDPSEKQIPAEDALDNLVQPSVPFEVEPVKEKSHDLLEDKIQPSVNQSQEPALSQGQSITPENTEDAPTDIDPSHDNIPDGEDVIPSGTVEQELDQKAEKAQAEESKDQTDTSKDMPQEHPEPTTKMSKKEKRKAKKAQNLEASDTTSNANSSADLQSWDWSNIDNDIRPEATAPETDPVPKGLHETLATAQPAQDTDVVTLPEQRDQLIDRVDSDQLVLDNSLPESQSQTGPEPQPEVEPEVKSVTAPVLHRQPEPESQPDLKPLPGSEPQVESEGSPIVQKKSKKDKKKKKGTSQPESDHTSDALTAQIQGIEGGSESPAAILESASQETQTGYSQENSPPLSEKKKSKKDKKRSKSLVEDPLSVPESTVDVAVPQHPTHNEAPQESQIPERQVPSPVEEPIQPQDLPTVTDDRSVEKAANVMDIPQSRGLAASEQRPRTPSSDQVRVAVDMSPAQLSSHIEHDRPFDQSTLPDKKRRTRVGEDDKILSEPLPMVVPGLPVPVPEASKTQSIDTVTRDSSLAFNESAVPNQDEISGPVAERQAALDVESEQMKIDDRPMMSKEKGHEDPVLVEEITRSVSEESPTEKPKKKKKKRKEHVDEDESATTAGIIGAGVGAGLVGIAEEAGESEKPKKKSKRADKKEKHEETSERKTMGEGSGLDAEFGDFGAGPSTETGQQTSATPRQTGNAATRQDVGQLIQQENTNIVDNTIESPTKSRELVPKALKPSTVDEASTPRKNTSTIESRDNKDLKTPEQIETRHQAPLHVEGRDAGEETSLTPLPPPRTPSALDYTRSLPPVEEETREDLEKELRSGFEDKVQMKPEANRDSGFITNSPNPQRHSLGLDEASQRDSGVHMRDWTAATTSDANDEKVHSQKDKTGVALDGTIEDSNSSRTPQPRERRSRRSLFDTETPKLSTPMQGRGWDRGNTPEKSGEDEPLKRTTTPSTQRGTKYQDLASSRDAGAALQRHNTPQHQTPRSVSDNTNLGDSVKREPTPQRSVSNTGISRLRTPEVGRYRPESPGSHSVHSVHSVRSIRSLRSSGANTPPLLRRVDRRMSGDLRSLSSLSHNDSTPSLHRPTAPPAARNKDKETASDRDTARDAASSSDRHAPPSTTTITPIANEGRVRAKDMPDVYDGYGEGRIGSPRSPTRPPSIRRRQSMQVLELEAKVEQLLAENRALADARAQAEQSMSYRNTSAITDRDAEIENLKASLKWLQNEVTRLTEVNEGLQSANSLLALQHNEKYTQLESQHITTTRELEEHRGAKDQYAQTLQAKDAEIQELRNQLEATKEQIREMKEQILATKPPDADFLRLKDEDHFDHRCQQLCSHVQQWVLRFSKFSDMRACRLTSEINDEKIIDRLDNTILDGSDVDEYLSDRVARRDIFMSMTMNMIWEFVFTRYLFGMDREQRQKLKSLEKILTDVGPPHAVRQWRAITLTLLSRRPAFGDQRNQDTEAVVQAILQTLSMILPPPSNLESQIQSQLRRVMREAVDLSIEMRTQRAEFMMLPPLQPEYDANGELTQTVTFNAALMHERSGDSSTNDEAYEAQGAVVRCVLFPLVVKKGDDNGIGDDEIVVSPAQVLVAKARRSTIRMVTPSSDAGGASLLNFGAPSNLSMPDAPLTPEYT